jgi:hypothetical protein
MASKVDNAYLTDVIARKVDFAKQALSEWKTAT